jgi:hypothetical protein
MQGQIRQEGSWMLKGIALLLVLLYLVNCCTPLRLHIDMLRYFAIKDCIELGCPPDSDAARDYMPFGYTALLLLLSKIGLLKSWSLVLINCIYLFGGIYLVVKIFKSSLNPMFLLILVLLNWTTIKFATHPMSEMQYLFFSTASIYLFYRYTQNKKILILISAFGMGAIAFLTRSVGITLAAALVTGLLWQYRKELIVLIRKHKLAVAGIFIVCIGVIVFSKQLGLNHYTGVFSSQLKGGVGLPTIWGWHFTEWAEIWFNIPIAKASGIFPSSSGKIIFLVAGILFFTGFVWLLFFRKNQVPFIVKAYIFYYSLLMINWPFYDPRFWVPVLPFVAAVLAQCPFPGPGLKRGLVYLLMASYTLLGAAAVGYVTYTSFNKKVFVRTQANGVFRNEYETLFYGKPQTDTMARPDPAIVNILRRYNR